MWSETWKKYLPVIAILLKRSAKGEQILNLDEADFLRAAGGKKIKHSFTNLRLNNGRSENNMNLSPMAKEFVQSLTNHDGINKLTGNQAFEFEITSNFRLIIKNNTLPPDDVRPD
jgi:hypothetical protein